jgi:hypothetical protein
LNERANPEQARKWNAKHVFARDTAFAAVLVVVQKVRARSVTTRLASGATDAFAFAKAVFAGFARFAFFAAGAAVFRVILRVRAHRAAANLIGFARDSRRTAFALAAFAHFARSARQTAAAAMFHVARNVAAAGPATGFSGRARRDPTTACTHA